MKLNPSTIKNNSHSNSKNRLKNKHKPKWNFECFLVIPVPKHCLDMARKKD